MHFNYLEMKYLVFCVTFNLLFFANIVSSTVTIAITSNDKTPGMIKYETKQALQLKCNVSKDITDDKEVVVEWKRNGQLVKDDKVINTRLSLSHNANKHTLQINNAKMEDAGKYECIAFVDGNDVARAAVNVESHVYVRIQKDISVVEGEKLKVLCIVHGSVNVTVSWNYKNVTYNNNTIDMGRVTLQKDPNNNISNAWFILHDVVLEDEGNLTCRAHSTISNDTSDEHTGQIRVKDKYAALWPFIGICAEVLVLCAIIFIYEKKRNKTELEESDTDQSPEQKNTPDHGGKESNLRHRQ